MINIRWPNVPGVQNLAVFQIRAWRHGDRNAKPQIYSNDRNCTGKIVLITSKTAWIYFLIERKRLMPSLAPSYTRVNTQYPYSIVHSTINVLGNEHFKMSGWCKNYCTINQLFVLYHRLFVLYHHSTILDDLFESIPNDKSTERCTDDHMIIVTAALDYRQLSYLCH